MQAGVSGVSWSEMEDESFVTAEFERAGGGCGGKATSSVLFEFAGRQTWLPSI